jgi:hypothetical protein
MSSQNSSPTTSIFDFDFVAASSEDFPPLHPSLLTLHTIEEYHYAMVLWYYQEGLQHLEKYQMSPSPSPSSSTTTTTVSPQTWSDSASPRVWISDDDLWANDDNNECDTVLTSIEFPQIQSLIDFPWTPTGVELPPLRMR